MSFRDTHPKSLRQEFGIPNFVDGDIMNRENTLRVLEAFKELGLSHVYVYSNKVQDNFKCFKVGKVISLLRFRSYTFVKLYLSDEGNLRIDDMNTQVTGDTITWDFDNFKLYPTLSLRYNNQFDKGKYLWYTYTIIRND